MGVAPPLTDVSRQGGDDIFKKSRRLFPERPASIDQNSRQPIRAPLENCNPRSYIQVGPEGLKTKMKNAMQPTTKQLSELLHHNHDEDWREGDKLIELFGSYDPYNEDRVREYAAQGLIGKEAEEAAEVAIERWTVCTAWPSWNEVIREKETNKAWIGLREIRRKRIAPSETVAPSVAPLARRKLSAA